MIDIMWILLAVCLVVAAYLLKMVVGSGFFSKIQPIVTESPKFLSTPVTVYYKYRVGSYSGTGSIISEVKDIVPAGATTFGIFYDSPEEVPEHQMQSAIGVVFGVDGKDLYQDNFGQQLTRCGFEKMTLPKISRAVQATQPNGGYLSLFALIFRTYGIVKQFIAEKRLETTISIEFYDEKEYCLVFPLDDAKDLYVKQYKTVEALEAEEAKKKFDSDVSEDSDSEAVNGSSAEEEEEEAAASSGN